MRVDITRIERQFDSFCIRVLSNTIKNIHRNAKHHMEHYVNFSDLSVPEMNRLAYEETFDIFENCVSPSRFQDYIENELLCSALEMLRAKDSNIIILAYWMKMTDIEISYKLGIFRSTVTNIRNRALKKLKKHMEEI